MNSLLAMTVQMKFDHYLIWDKQSPWEQFAKAEYDSHCNLMITEQPCLDGEIARMGRVNRMFGVLIISTATRVS